MMTFCIYNKVLIAGAFLDEEHGVITSRSG